jgi:hypothetical protein
MAHFAEIDESNTVIRVLVTSDEHPEEGHTWLVENLGGTWMKTSYNTVGGVHKDPETGADSEDQSKSFRKNFASIGHTYDAGLDAFIPEKTYESWLLDEETCLWQSPIPYPADGKDYSWDEETLSWVEITPVEEQPAP